MKTIGGGECEDNFKHDKNGGGYGTMGKRILVYSIVLKIDGSGIKPRSPNEIH